MVNEDICPPSPNQKWNPSNPAHSALILLTYTLCIQKTIYKFRKLGSPKRPTVDMCLITLAVLTTMLMWLASETRTRQTGAFVCCAGSHFLHSKSLHLPKHLSLAHSPVCNVSPHIFLSCSPLEEAGSFTFYYGLLRYKKQSSNSFPCPSLFSTINNELFMIKHPAL